MAAMGGPVESVYLGVEDVQMEEAIEVAWVPMEDVAAAGQHLDSIHGHA